MQQQLRQQIASAQMDRTLSSLNEVLMSSKEWCQADKGESWPHELSVLPLSLTTSTSLPFNTVGGPHSRGVLDVSQAEDPPRPWANDGYVSDTGGSAPPQDGEDERS